MTTIRGAVFDLDGTLVRGAAALPGAVDAVAELKRRGLRVVYCTQDSVNPPTQVAAKLRGLGFEAAPDDVFCAGWFAARHLANAYPGARVFAMCSKDLRQSLLDYGLSLVGGDEARSADLVFIAREPGYGPERMAAACSAIWAGATFYAFGHDRLLPLAGRNAPGAGALVKAIEYATRRPARVLGKPSKTLALATLARLGADAQEAVFVGDSLDSDIRLGRGVGARGVLVLTGGATSADAEAATGPRKPVAVLASVAALPEWIAGQG